MTAPYFLTVCLNPTIQKIIVLPTLIENEVNRSWEYFTDVSGKGVNVSRALLQLGSHAVHLTQAGGTLKNIFLEMAAKEEIPLETVESGSEIRYCYTLLSTANHTATEIVEESVPVDAATEDLVLSRFAELLPGSHTVIISGSKAPGFSDELFPSMVQRAKAHGKSVILDFRGKDLKNSLQYGPDVIKPNFTEFCMTFLPDRVRGENHHDDETERLVKSAMLDLFRQHGTVSVLTRGKYDILFCDRGEIRSLPVKPVVPVNTVGCGDAFTAGLGFAFHHGHSLLHCVEKGRDCAALNALQIRPRIR